MTASELKENMKNSRLWDCVRVPAQKLSIWTNDMMKISYKDGRKRMSLQLYNYETHRWGTNISINIDDVYFDDIGLLRVKSWERRYNAICNSTV